jgi:hypothetical protein
MFNAAVRQSVVIILVKGHVPGIALTLLAGCIDIILA